MSVKPVILLIIKCMLIWCIYLCWCRLKTRSSGICCPSAAAQWGRIERRQTRQRRRPRALRNGSPNRGNVTLDGSLYICMSGDLKSLLGFLVFFWTVQAVVYSSFLLPDDALSDVYCYWCWCFCSGKLSFNNRHLIAAMQIANVHYR